MAASTSVADAFERLAVAQGLYKAVAQAVSTKSDHNVRAEADDALADLLTTIGTDRVTLCVRGHDVGTLRVRYAKASDGAEVTDEGVLEAWLADNGERTYDLHPEWLTPNQLERVAGLMRDVNPSSVVPRSVMPNDMERGLREGPGGCVLTAEGEVVPGMRWRRVPKLAVGTTIHGCEPERVAAALKGALPETIMALLGEGGEE